MEIRVRKRNTLVVKANNLINARHDLTVNETRLFLLTVSQIHREDKDFHTYRIWIKDFMEVVGTNSKAHYERAREVTANLMSKVMEIPEQNGPLQVAFLSSAKYYTGKGYVDVTFDPRLKPYLLQLKERFTEYDIRNVLPLQSFYSMRFYELLKQYARIGKRIMAVDEIKYILELPESYDHYASFKRRVILQAQHDLRGHTDLSFDFEEIKTGRKVTHIRFIIHDNGIPPEELPALPSEDGIEAQREQQKLLEELVGDFGFTETQAKQAIAANDPSYIRGNLATVTKKYKAGRIKNLTAYTLKALKEDFRPREGALERQRRKKLEAFKEQQQREQELASLEDKLLTQYEQELDQQLEHLARLFPQTDLVRGFSEYIQREQRFAYDFVRAQAAKKSKEFDITKHLEHELIRPVYKRFLAKKHLDARYHSFHAWRLQLDKEQ